MKSGYKRTNAKYGKNKERPKSIAHEEPKLMPISISIPISIPISIVNYKHAPLNVKQKLGQIKLKDLISFYSEPYKHLINSHTQDIMCSSYCNSINAPSEFITSIDNPTIRVLRDNGIVIYCNNNKFARLRSFCKKNSNKILELFVDMDSWNNSRYEFDSRIYDKKRIYQELLIEINSHLWFPNILKLNSIYPIYKNPPKKPNNFQGCIYHKKPTDTLEKQKRTEALIEAGLIPPRPYITDLKNTESFTFNGDHEAHKIRNFIFEHWLDYCYKHTDFEKLHEYYIDKKSEIFEKWLSYCDKIYDISDIYELYPENRDLIFNKWINLCTHSRDFENLIKLFADKTEIINKKM